jgi:hypothetical protein
MNVSVWFCLQTNKYSTQNTTGPANCNINTDLVITNLTDLQKLTVYRPLLSHMQGIYAFKNTINSKQYIGSAQDLYKRL